jgi:hypothetical protein
MTITYTNPDFFGAFGEFDALVKQDICLTGSQVHSIIWHAVNGHDLRSPEDQTVIDLLLAGF